MSSPLAQHGRQELGEGVVHPLQRGQVAGPRPVGHVGAVDVEDARQLLRGRSGHHRLVVGVLREGLHVDLVFGLAGVVVGHDLLDRRPTRSCCRRCGSTWSAFRHRTRHRLGYSSCRPWRRRRRSTATPQPSRPRRCVSGWIERSQIPPGVRGSRAGARPRNPIADGVAGQDGRQTRDGDGDLQAARRERHDRGGPQR